MRRLTTPLVVLLLTAVVVMLGIGLLRDDSSTKRGAGRTASTAAGRPLSAELRAANEVLLSTVPLPPGSRFFTRQDVSARSGAGWTTHLYFASSAGPQAVVDHFKSTLTGTGAGGGWTLVGELNVPSRIVAKFQKGDAWLEVAASEIDVAGTKTPGFTVIVNAKDAKIFSAL